MKPHEIAPSDAQWDAIGSADEHLLINAGAGTGKTFTVVAKALYLMGVEIRGQVIQRPLALRDIAAITYTNKAAAELKDKLRTGLRRAGRRREAYQVDTARVGTIHSFCSDILSEFALRSGRAPRLALVGEADGKIMEADVVRDVLLAAVESGSVDGLSDLLSARSIREVQTWVRQLLEHGDALQLMRAEPRSPELVLLRLAQQAHSALVARLDESGQMDYDRMIVWTRDLLRDDATVRKALQRRIRVLIIDECQDIDPVQREIAYLLADPTNRRTDTTRLVLVGDPKQSIYRFRKADVTVWRTIERDLQENRTGRVVTLGESRRSVAPVLAFVDDFVGTLLDSPGDESRGMQDYEVPYLPLAALRSMTADDDAAPQTGVELIAVPALDTGKACNADITRRSEARAIAERVKELRASGVQWRDMALLLCGWGGVDIYMDALRAAGIPAYTLRAEGFWGCREVLDVTIALAAILDPHDDRLLYGFLRSPFVGLTDETLLRIALHTGNPVWGRIEGVILPDAGEQARLMEGMKLLQRFGRIRDRVPVARLVEQLLDETGYLLHLQLLGETRDGTANQRIANVRKLTRIAGANPEVTIADFLRMVEQERDLGIKEGEAVLYGERDDVVTVTSVHSAKGLEWKCVFWADLIRSRATDNDRLVVNGARIALGEPDLKPVEQSASWQEVRDSIVAEELAETKRLWYVAATRARDLLVLSGVGLGSGARPNAPSTALRARFPQLDEMPASVSYRGSDGASYSAVVRYATVIEEDVADAAGGIRADADADAAFDVDVAPDRADYVRPREAIVVPFGRGRYSASAVMSFQRCERRYWLKRIAGLQEEKVRADSPDGAHGSIDATRYGTIIHDILEHVDADSDVTTMVGIALGECGDDMSLMGGGERRDSIREKLTDEIERTMGRPEYRELRDAEGARRELAFTFIDRSACFDGRLDMVVPGADGYRILDVKTGMSAAGDPAAIAAKSAEYAMQRAIYTRAVETIAGGPVREFVFDFTGPGMQEVVRGETLASSSGATAELLESTLARARDGASELTNDPSMCRWCGYLSSGWCTGASAAPAGTRAGLKLL